MGCCFSKTPSQRSSRSSEKIQNCYSPSAPSWDIINSSSGYTLRRRDEERSSNPRRQRSDEDPNQRIAAYKKRNDCMFYYYTKCVKGDRCEYRHEPAALGSKKVCCLWKDQKCFAKHCQFRHMTLENNKKICYWEEEHGICRVRECPFKHSKAEDEPDCSKVKPENKRGSDAGNHNQSGKPKHHGGERNRSGCRPQFDKERQSTNSTAAAQGLSAELLQQVQLKVKEVQDQLQKKLEGDRAHAMEMFKKDHEKLANIMLEEKTKEIIEKMEGVLNCCICFELFVSPVTLNCSHTFCQFCIKEWRKDNVNCPLCRDHITSEARALNIDNLIEEMIPDFPEEMKRKRENVIRLREILSSLPY